MITISILNQKGGVGKTTTAAALASKLSRDGKRVLAIDMDPQYNLTTAFLSTTPDATLMDVLCGSATIVNSVTVVSDTLDLLSGDPNLVNANAMITETGKEHKLRKALIAVRDKYDYCVIDTPPALGVLTVNALTASDYTVIPSQAGIFSLRGIQDLMNTVEAVKEYCNPNLKIAGILLTMSAKTNVGGYLKDSIEKYAETIQTKVFSTEIRKCIAAEESHVCQKNIYEYAPNSHIAADYAAFVDELVKEISA